ncbi:hypothetical protein HYU22_04860 [Candidatus Woesearchaeota archaeon]|nr:hypothetical protein [Candidatus Woesearchaeota archaeon]
MGLTDLVRSLALSAALALPAAHCTTNNYYSGDGGSGGGRACGNSPLTGQYLWNVGNCEMGAERPADRDCNLYLASDDDLLQFSYQGLTLMNDRGDHARLLRNFSCDDVCSDSTPEEITRKCNNYQCALERDIGLYVVESGVNLCDEAGHCDITCQGVGLVDNLWVIKNSPWPGTEECRSMELYDRSCFSGGGP